MLERRLQDQYLFTKVFDEAPIGMALVSPDGRFIKVNQSICIMFGYSEDEFATLTIQDVTHPDDLGENLELRAKANSGEIDGYRMEKRYINKSGEVIWGLLSVSVERDEMGEVGFFISQLIDITEQKRREESIREAEKLSLAGQLAAGIAHEIRNPLTSLRGFVQLLQNEDPIEKKAFRYKVMLNEIDRINEIVSELLVLAKPVKENTILGNVPAMLEDVLTLLEAHANLHNVEITRKFTYDLPYIRCQSSLKQVFINMTKNAVESMPQGGMLIVQAASAGDKVVVSFIDNGCGIEEELLQKIGQPFFTTKETGTGLGIMISKRIIQNHNGTLIIESQVGKGTSVTIHLPAI